MRPSTRKPDETREIRFTRNYTKHAEGSVLIEMGDTKVICTASLTPGVPRFLKGQGQGWVTAEYGMLPRSTNERMNREATGFKQGGRTVEIQRLIGRSLRAAVDLKKMGEYTITIDCDVIQADGGTRCAAITGGAVALKDALDVLARRRKETAGAFKGFVSAISVGIYKGEAVLDLDYQEDSNADTDLNAVFNHKGGMIEIQGTAESEPFSQAQLTKMLNLADKGARELLDKQHTVCSR